jgi:hypothetical protein
LNELVGELPYSAIGYSKKSGRFRDLTTGQFVPRSRVLLEVDREIERTSVRLQGIVRLLASEKVDLPEFQIRFAEELKIANLRMAAFGAGGRSQMNASQFGHVGQKLKQEYGFLDGFAQDLADGRLSIAQALNRAAMYAESTAQAFHRAEQQTKARDGFLGKRSLDVGANHCASCPAYATDGYVPANQIVPVGVNCECRRRCRCFIVWKVGLSDRLPEVS